MILSHMNKLVMITILLVTASGCGDKASAGESLEGEGTLLIFSKTEGFRHDSIEDGAAALQQLAKDKGWSSEHTEDASVFTPESLKGYDAVIFLSTTGNILNDEQQKAFEQYIQNGGGFVGIHAAADTEYEWPWYGKLVGAYFESHPHIQEATLVLMDADHPSTSFLPEQWQRTDEWYNYKEINPDIHVLLNLDESSYEGGNNGEHHPAAWYHEYDGGRAFYTAGGHTSESYEEELFLKHVWGGIEYAMAK